MSPIGFEREPLNCLDIYAKSSNHSQYLDWILIGDSSRKYHQIHCVKWQDIDTDLNLKYPNYINIRRLDKGILQKGCKEGFEINCLIHFKKLNSDPFVCIDNINLKFEPVKLESREPKTN